MQESRCIFDGITSNLPIMRRAYAALIVLSTVFSLASLVIYHGISHLSLVFSWCTHSSKSLIVCTPIKFKWLVGFSTVNHSKALHN